MKRVILYCAITIAVLLVPLKRQDVAELEPIQAVYLNKEDNMLIMQTDTLDRGRGNNAQEALAEMQKQSSGIIYLDTAQYLLVTEDTTEYIIEMIPLLKDSVKVCLWGGEGDLAEGAKYMQAHKIGCRLDKWNQSVNMPKMPLQNKSK